MDRLYISTNFVKLYYDVLTFLVIIVPCLHTFISIIYIIMIFVFCKHSLVSSIDRINIK